MSYPFRCLPIFSKKVKEFVCLFLDNLEFLIDHKVSGKLFIENKDNYVNEKGST